MQSLSLEITKQSTPAPHPPNALGFCTSSGPPPLLGPLPHSPLPDELKQERVGFRPGRAPENLLEGDEGRLQGKMVTSRAEVLKGRAGGAFGQEGRGAQLSTARSWGAPRPLAWWLRGWG